MNCYTTLNFDEAEIIEGATDLRIITTQIDDLNLKLVN